MGDAALGLKPEMKGPIRLAIESPGDPGTGSRRLKEPSHGFIVHLDGKAFSNCLRTVFGK